MVTGRVMPLFLMVQNLVVSLVDKAQSEESLRECELSRSCEK